MGGRVGSRLGLGVPFFGVFGGLVREKFEVSTVGELEQKMRPGC